LDLTSCFEIDLGDVARLDYYTGLTFKIYVKGAGYRVGSGGRYDGLTASFGKAEPAVGFVVDLDALTDVVRLRPTDLSSTRTQLGGPPELRANGAGEKRSVDVEDSAKNPSELFIEALERRAKGERVSLKLLR
jgi:ATP phosphoribosyltransferase regulatory subunit HisZ